MVVRFGRIERCYLMCFLSVWLQDVEAESSKPRYIQTVWGVGYVFVPDGNATK